jgi:hypothetical protein
MESPINVCIEVRVADLRRAMWYQSDALLHGAQGHDLNGSRDLNGKSIL